MSARLHDVCSIIWCLPNCMMCSYPYNVWSTGVMSAYLYNVCSTLWRLSACVMTVLLHDVCLLLHMMFTYLYDVCPLPITLLLNCMMSSYLYDLIIYAVEYNLGINSLKHRKNPFLHLLQRSLLDISSYIVRIYGAICLQMLSLLEPSSSKKIFAVKFFKEQ